jgi:hypothetical protein
MENKEIYERLKAFKDEHNAITKGPLALLSLRLIHHERLGQVWTNFLNRQGKDKNKIRERNIWAQFCNTL